MAGNVLVDYTVASWIHPSTGELRREFRTDNSPLFFSVLNEANKYSERTAVDRRIYVHVLRK